MFKPDEIKLPEKKMEVETKTILEFMRHAQPESSEGKTDERRRLTSAGRAQSNKKGEELDPQTRASLAWSSPRDRAKETAYRVMLANEDIDPNASLEEIEEAISKEVKFGKKMIIDERLDYNDAGELGNKLWEADDKGEFYSWLLDESDKEALKYPGNKTITYTRAAGNIAEIIKRYTKFGNNFNKAASRTDEYKKFNNQIERYLGTHQGIVELFIAKLLEKIKGIEKRDEFIKALGEGFDFTSGPRIEIINKGNYQSIYLIYDDIDGEKEKLEIKRELLEEIITEKVNLEKLVNAHK
jgi:broad specificity phosphatase PhoE